MEVNPDNEDAIGALRLQLTKQMKADKTLIDTVRKILDEIEQDKALQTFLTQVYGGEVGQIINAHHIDMITYKKELEAKVSPVLNLGRKQTQNSLTGAE